MSLRTPGLVESKGSKWSAEVGDSWFLAGSGCGDSTSCWARREAPSPAGPKYSEAEGLLDSGLNAKHFRFKINPRLGSLVHSIFKNCSHSYFKKL